MILITGGTGFLGAHLAAHLLEEGDEVILLARSKQGLSAADRVGRLLDWLGVAANRKKNVHLVEGRLEHPGLGLEPDASAFISREIDEIVHCASSTSFAERRRAEVEAVNLDGLRHVLDLAERSRCRRFHFISTAYVAGINSGHCLEELVRPAAFTNVYEETKCRAEWLASERCAKAGLRLSIYRPSIVYGLRDRPEPPFQRPLLSREDGPLSQEPLRNGYPRARRAESGGNGRALGRGRLDGHAHPDHGRRRGRRQRRPC